MGPPTLSLRIRRSQVRVLPSAPKKALQIALNYKGPGYRPERIYCNRSATHYYSTLSIAFAACSPIPATRWEYVPRCMGRSGRSRSRAVRLPAPACPLLRTPPAGSALFPCSLQWTCDFLSSVPLEPYASTDQREESTRTLVLSNFREYTLSAVGCFRLQNRAGAFRRSPTQGLLLLTRKCENYSRCA